MKRKLLSILLTLCMVLTLLPTAALAVEPDVMTVTIGNAEPTNYQSFETGWNAAVAATEAVTVTLLKDWTADLSSHSFGIGAGFGNQGYIRVPSGKTITLDLNGKAINRGLTEAVSEGEVIEVKGNLTLQNTGNSENGKITGANSSDGYGAVYVYGGTFTMEGGSITGNKASNTGSDGTAAAGGVYTSGTFNMTGGSINYNTANGANGAGGVYVSPVGTFNMTGGEIRINTANGTNSAGGVYMDNTAFTMTAGSILVNKGGGAGGVLVATGDVKTNNSLTVGGTAWVINNKLTNNTINNVLLQNKPSGGGVRTITCSTITPLTSGAAIGVTTQTPPAVNAPVTITDQSSADYSQYFRVDNYAYETRNSGENNAQVVQLVAPGAITIKVNDDLEYDGDNLFAAVAASSVSADNILTLTITAGTVTEADWTWFAGSNPHVLSNLEHFTVEKAVTAVANIPDSTSKIPIFPNTIQTVDIPKVQKIGTRAFSACKKLVTANFPAATAIGEGAFDSCNRLGNANFPKVKTIGDSAFNSCFESVNTGLKTANFPEATTIGEGAFSDCLILETANFPKAETIGEKAFNSCSTNKGAGLGTANFPEAKTIGTYAFERCHMLETATFPKATTIGIYAFYGCDKLATATFPKATTIGATAFKGCGKLATATFPKATTIGATAFENCEKLTKLTLGATPPTTVADAFTNCPGTRILALADENGGPLSAAAWTAAQVLYKNVDDVTPADDLWYGWIVPAAPTPTPAPTPNATFTATGASSGALSGLTANESYKYSVNGGSYYTDFTGATATIADGIDTTNGVWVVKNGNNTTTIDSEPQKITITKAAAPTTVGKTDCTTSAQNNGKITGVADTMEYKLDSATTYTAISGTEVTNLVPATYNVRIKASGTVLAGADISVTIGSYNATVIYEDDYIPPVQTTVESGKNVNAFDLKALARESKSLTVIGKNGTKLLLDAESIKALADGSGSLNVIVSEAKGKLSSEQTAIVGANSVYELTATLNGKPITNFGGKVTVTLPYTLKSGEKAENVTVWYLATDGTLTKIPATYDAKTGLATFTVTHFSLYIVGVPEKSNNPFTDINSGNYYYDAVLWAVGKGITNGATATAFSPDGSCTRADMVTFLWRAMGSPEPKATNLFADVPANAYYSKAVMWAVEKGITLGTGKTEFSPQAIVNRSQTVTFLWRMAGNPKATATNAFTDVGADAYYANAVLWAVEKNITDGTSAKTFSPLSPCSRGQIVTFLYRYLAK